MSAAPPFRVEVIRSKRRRRTIGAQMVGGVLVISVPAATSKADELYWVETMSRRFSRSMTSDRIDLVARASALARRYDLPRPTAISWSEAMNTRWGSCTSTTGTVRISNRIAAFPAWVLDYVIVHELAHIAQPDHSAAFWRLVHRYAKAERAIGYLIAKAGDDDGGDDHDADDHDADDHDADNHEPIDDDGP